MWTKSELKAVRADLAQQLDQLRKTSAGLRGEVAQSLGGEVNGVVGETPAQWSELSNRQAEEDVAITVLDVESQLQHELASAIVRIDTDQYGLCETCGKRITKERLKAVPHARQCMVCAKTE
jgi:DnaK suppressor protein